jgi:hypothetical protein
VTTNNNDDYDLAVLRLRLDIHEIALQSLLMTLPADQSERCTDVLSTALRGWMADRANGAVREADRAAALGRPRNGPQG